MKKLRLSKIKKIGPVFALIQLKHSLTAQGVGNVMTRIQLVNKLALRMKITKKDADICLTAILDSIMDSLVKGERVVVQGFGSFKVKELKARKAKKPLSGEFIQLSVRRKLSFHAGKELRERVNQDMELLKEAESLIDNLQVHQNVFEATMG